MTQRSKPERNTELVLLFADAIAQKLNGFDPKKTTVTDETGQTVAES